MALKVAVQMDPLEGIDIRGDSTFALMLEAQARGHGLFVYGPDALAFSPGRVTARGQRVMVRDVEGDHFSYITATHILEHIHPRTLVVNDPREVRNAPEKLFVLEFADLFTATAVRASSV